MVRKTNYVAEEGAITATDVEASPLWGKRRLSGCTREFRVLRRTVNSWMMPLKLLDSNVRT